MHDIFIPLIILVFSVIAHELAHGYAAKRLGDPTAELMGRLTINPLAHVDVFGSIIVPLLTAFGGIPFGWAKPVPYNPYNLRDQKWGIAKVAAAGPTTNLAIAIIFGLVLAFARQWIPAGSEALFEAAIFINVGLAIFNLCPIPPLDGFSILASVLPQRYSHILHFLERYSFVILILFIYLGGTMIIRPIEAQITSLLVNL